MNPGESDGEADKKGISKNKEICVYFAKPSETIRGFMKSRNR